MASVIYVQWSETSWSRIQAVPNNVLTTKTRNSSAHNHNRFEPVQSAVFVAHIWQPIFFCCGWVLNPNTGNLMLWWKANVLTTTSTIAPLSHVSYIEYWNLTVLLNTSSYKRVLYLTDVHFSTHVWSALLQCKQYTHATDNSGGVDLLQVASL